MAATELTHEQYTLLLDLAREESRAVMVLALCRLYRAMHAWIVAQVEPLVAAGLVAWVEGEAALCLTDAGREAVQWPERR